MKSLILIALAIAFACESAFTCSFCRFPSKSSSAAPAAAPKTPTTAGGGAMQILYAPPPKSSLSDNFFAQKPAAPAESKPTARPNRRGDEEDEVTVWGGVYQ